MSVLKELKERQNEIEQMFGIFFYPMMQFVSQLPVEPGDDILIAFLARAETHFDLTSRAPFSLVDKVTWDKQTWLP